MNTQLYFFECGTIKTHKHLLTMNKDIGKLVEVPVPFFLIKHPKGNVLFDTGNSLQAAKDSKKSLSEVSNDNPYVLVMNEEQYVVNQLKKIGVAANDITHVVLSHLHMDHSGGIGEFPNATYIVQRKELEWAYVPDFYQKNGYVRADFDKNVSWQLLNGETDDGYDPFGDGVLHVLFTPGPYSRLAVTAGKSEGGRTFLAGKR